MNHIVMLSTNHVPVAVSNNVIVMIDVVAWRRVIGRILVNDVVVLSTDYMPVTVSNDVIVMVNVVTRLVNRIVLREGVSGNKRCACDHGKS